jgi:hypothetical protein
LHIAFARRLAVFGSLLALAAPLFAANPAATIDVDVAANRHAIDPRIYGLAFATTAQLNDLNVPLNRSGGNTTSRYNWQVNADNKGFDWYFQSLAYSSAVAGEGGDTFITESRAGGAQPMLTIPMVGWVAKLGPNRGRLSSFSIAKYGAQQDADWQWFPDAGNGVRTNGTLVTGNDPNDASTPADSTFQQGWVTHLVIRWGLAANGGLRYYLLDNEPSIWHSTHRDVHPTGASMDEMLQKTIDYAAKIKAIDPGAIVIGPEEWGWSGYFWSGLDQQTGAANGWTFFPDRSSHANKDYLPWLLEQLKANEVSTGKRLLDVFSVHYYPQGGEFGNDTSAAMQQRRNRSTRSLWDPAYTDETWINDKVRLIPRMKGWVSSHYPGTKIAITEYNWGAEGHINGATAQADIFGIFGREGLDIGARWTTPATGSPVYNAIKLYRNYDGARSAFGDTSVSAGGPNPDNVAAFAAQRSSDGTLTIMVVGKYASSTTPVTINLAHFAARGPAQVWQLAAGGGITRLADVPIASSTLSTSVPGQSITLFVVPRRVSVTADFDGDAKGDIAWRNSDGRSALWLMNGTTVASSGEIMGAGTGWSVALPADLDGDGKTDLVWHHTDGRVAAWLMNGTIPSATAQIVNAGGWSASHTGDFDGDGKADLVLRHTDGTTAIWLMNGTSVASGASVIGAGTGWSVAKVGDFDADGKADLLWVHADGRVAIWLMNGTAVKASAQILNAGSGWNVSHVADLDGDGKKDIVWKHTGGSVAAWLMSGTAMASGGGVLGAGSGWTVSKAGDFNGDGKSDLLFQHADGRVAIYLMNGLAPSATTQILNAGPWTAARVADLDGDGKSDIVWQHTDGRAAVWLMNGTSMSSGGEILGAGSGWSVAAPD